MDLFRQTCQKVNVLTENLHRHVAANARHQFVETHLNGLGELGRHTGNVVEGVLPFLTSFPPGSWRKSILFGLS
jgi:hypothetical protein